MPRRRAQEFLDLVGNWLRAEGKESLQGQTVVRCDLRLLVVEADGDTTPLPEDATLGEVDLRSCCTNVLVNTLPLGNQLRMTRGAAQHAAYNATRVANGTDHLRVARDIHAQGTSNSHPDMLLGDINGWGMKRLQKVLNGYAERPECVCFHCGIAGYPSEMSTVTITGLDKRENCRAHVVYERQIRALAERHGFSTFPADSFRILRCERVPPPEGAKAAGHNGPYFKADACKHCAKLTKSPLHDELWIHQPHATNLHDGWRPEEGNRRNIGLDDDVPLSVSSLPDRERFGLSAIKAPCSTFRAYNVRDYHKFAGGAYFMPQDYIGTCAVSTACARGNPFSLVHAAGPKSMSRIETAWSTARKPFPLPTTSPPSPHHLSVLPAHHCGASAMGLPAVPRPAAAPSALLLTPKSSGPLFALPSSSSSCPTADRRARRALRACKVR